MPTLRYLYMVLIHIVGHVATSHITRTELTDPWESANETQDTTPSSVESDFTSSASASFSSSWTGADGSQAGLFDGGDEDHSGVLKHVPKSSSIPTRFTTSTSTSTSSSTRFDLIGRDIESSAVSTCSPLLTAKRVVATCTLVAGKAKGQICRRRSTATVSGCDVTDATSTTTIASTITAYCDSSGSCGGSACQAKHERAAQGESKISALEIAGASTPRLERKDSGRNLSDLVEVKAPKVPENPDVPGPLEEPKDYDSYAKFMVEEMGKAERLNQVLHRVNDPTGSSSSIVRAFKKKAINVGVRDLYGCTSVVAISRRGVWISHLFEVPTFANPETNAAPDEDVWMKDAEQGIFIGDQSGKFLGLNAFTAGEPDLSLFDSMKYGQTTNRASIFIITPVHPDEDIGIPTATEGFWDCKYSVEIERLHKVLSATYKEVTVATYDDSHGGQDTPDRDATMESTGKGRVFVQYTPRSNIEPEDPNAGSADPAPTCESQKAMIRLWTYGNPPGSGDQYSALFEDEWDAMPDQIIKPIEKNKDILGARDDADGYKDSCVWFGDETSATSSQTQTKSTSILSASIPATITPTVSASTPSTTAPPLTLMGDLTCNFASTTGASSSIISYCTCNDHQVHGAFTTAGNEGGATVMCNPKDPEGTPIFAQFTHPAQLPFQTGICRLELHERTNGTIEELSRPNDAYIAVLPPITTLVQMYDGAGLQVMSEIIFDYRPPFDWRIKPNKDMGFPYSVKVWPSINKGQHSVFLDHLWNFEQTYDATSQNKYTWTTDATVEQPPKTYPRCLSGEWTEKDTKSDRFVQCWFIC